MRAANCYSCVWNQTPSLPRNAKFLVSPQPYVCLSTAPYLEWKLFQQKPDGTKEKQTLYITVHCSFMIIKAKFCCYLSLHLVPWSVASCSGLFWVWDEFFQQMVLLPVKHRQVFSSPHGGQRCPYSHPRWQSGRAKREKQNRSRLLL